MTVSRIASALIVAIALAVRLPWLVRDLPALAEGIVPDDAFYYFAICRRVWDGRGISFDGAAPSSGLHLLWLVALLPLFALPGPLAPVRSALGLCSALAALTSLRLRRFAAELGTPAWLSAALGATYAMHLWVTRESLSGLETALGQLLVAAALVRALAFCQAPDPRGAALLGGLVGLAVFARSDSLLPLGGLLLPALWQARGRARLWLAGLPAAAVALLCAINLARTGQPLQSSAMAVPWVMRANWELLFPGDAAERHRVGVLLFSESFTAALQQSGPTGVMGLVAAVLAVYAALVRRGRGGDSGLFNAPDPRWALALLAGLAGGLVGLHAVHGYLRWFPRSWYFVYWPLVALATVAAAHAGLVAADRRGLARALALAVPLVCGLEAARAARGIGHVMFPQQQAMLVTGLALDRLLPVGAVPGAFNAGMMGYVARTPVVNLDGVVNEPAARAIRSRTLSDYMRARGITHVADFPLMWDSPSVERLFSLQPSLGPAFRFMPFRALASHAVEHPGEWHGVRVDVLELDWDWQSRFDGRVAIDAGTPLARRYLEAGWRDARGEDRTWSAPSGRTASVSFPALPGRPLAVSLTARRSSPDAVRVTLNGRPLPAPALTAAWSDATLTAAADAVQAVNRLTFEDAAGLELDRLDVRPGP